MAGLATTFGSGAMTNSISEIEQADVIIVSGSNTTEAHPQIARRIIDAVDGSAGLIVIDPRKTDISKFASVHLQIRPGTDIPLLNCIMRIILDENLVDDVFIEMRTENYVVLRDMLYRLDLDETAAETGVSLEKIRRAAKLFGRAHKGVFCYCLGITQHICGTDNVRSIANLAMLTGNVEKQDTGVDPLRGQNNVQGACDMGALPNVFPGYQGVADPTAREKFSRAWKSELSDKPGLTLLDMTHKSRENGLHAMFIMGENPMLSDPVQDKVKETFDSLEFLAVADIFLTETARCAHVVFPAASFAEKSGTFTNSERRVQHVRQAIEPIGDSRTDSEIITDLSAGMGYAMAYDNPAEIMEEIAMLTPLYGGMHHDRLNENWGLQWPCPDRNHPGTPYLHKHSFTRGKGLFQPASHQEPGEPPDEQYPFKLMTGRVYHHYHTGAMTRASHLLSRECPRALLEINPEDADRLGVRDGEYVTLSTRRGNITICTKITDRVQPGMLYTSFHFHEAPVNKLTIGSVDPTAKCPEYKICAARLERIQS